MAVSVRKTPPIGAYGTFVLNAPWDSASNKTYRCIALQRVEQFTKAGLNVFELVYSPMGLSQDVYNADVAIDVVIVGLLATDGTRIYVPDTYIQSYPDQSSIAYNYTVMSVDLGPQPSKIDLSNCVSDLKDLVSKYTGLATSVITVDVHTALSTTSMTQAQYIAALDAQQNALANVQTKDQIIKQLQATITSQNNVIQQLTSK